MHSNKTDAIAGFLRNAERKESDQLSGHLSGRPYSPAAEPNVEVDFSRDYAEDSFEKNTNYGDLGIKTADKGKRKPPAMSAADRKDKEFNLQRENIELQSK